MIYERVINWTMSWNTLFVFWFYLTRFARWELLMQLIFLLKIPYRMQLIVLRLKSVTWTPFIIFVYLHDIIKDSLHDDCICRYLVIAMPYARVIASYFSVFCHQLNSFNVLFYKMKHCRHQHFIKYICEPVLYTVLFQYIEWLLIMTILLWTRKTALPLSNTFTIIWAENHDQHFTNFHKNQLFSGKSHTKIPLRNATCIQQKPLADCPLLFKLFIEERIYTRYPLTDRRHSSIMQKEDFFG